MRVCAELANVPQNLSLAFTRPFRGLYEDGGADGGADLGMIGLVMEGAVMGRVVMEQRDGGSD